MDAEGIPLVTAKELRPLVALLTAEERALIESWCEVNRAWVEQGKDCAPVVTSQLRGLLRVTIRLARECLKHEGAAKARAVMVTIPEIGPSPEEGGL